MEHGKPFWKQNIAAIGLIDLQDPRGHDYLFKEMEKPDQERHFFAALGLGLAMARNDPIKLDENDRQTLSKRLEEGRDQNQTGNQFQRDLAEAILKRLKEKDKLQSSK